jgi:hypothetical protein
MYDPRFVQVPYVCENSVLSEVIGMIIGDRQEVNPEPLEILYDRGI